MADLSVAVSEAVSPPKPSLADGFAVTQFKPQTSQGMSMKLVHRPQLLFASFVLAALLAASVQRSFGANGGDGSSLTNVACPEPNAITGDMTPVELYAAVPVCVRKPDLKTAATLFALAGLYGRFDATRVADPSAGQAALVLAQFSLESLSQQERAAFQELLTTTLWRQRRSAAVLRESKADRAAKILSKVHDPTRNGGISRKEQKQRWFSRII